MIVTCAQCGQEKEHKAKGLCSMCYARLWRRANPDKVRRYRKEHNEQRAMYNREYRKRDPEKWREYHRRWDAEHREQRCEISQRYREKHPERVEAYKEANRETTAAYHRRYNRKNRERRTAYMRRWRKQNPGKVAANQQRRKARESKVLDTLTPEEAEELRKTGEAMYPGKELHLDHIVPLSKGGGTTRANVHFIPATLNCSKGDKSPQEVYMQLELSDIES